MNEIEIISSKPLSYKIYDMSPLSVLKGKNFDKCFMSCRKV